MGTKRISDEEVIVSFFNHAEQGKAETLFNVIKGIMRHRTASSPAASGPVGVVARRTNPKGNTGQGRGAVTTSKPAGGQASNAVEATTPSPVKDQDSERMPM